LKSQVGKAGGANRASPAGLPKRRLLGEWGRCAGRAIPEKTLPSHGPQANTKCLAEKAPHRDVASFVIVPLPSGVTAWAIRNSAFFLPGFFHYELHSAPRQEHAAARFEQAAADAIEIYLWIALCEGCVVHQPRADAAGAQGLPAILAAAGRRTKSQEKTPVF